MITNFKIFENVNYEKYTENVFFNINSSDINYILSIIQQLDQIINIDKEKIKKNYKELKKSLSKQYTNFSGVFIVFHNITHDNNTSLGYWVYFENGSDFTNKNVAKKEISKNNIKYIGELKLANNKIYVDTIENDTEKYNI